MSERIRFRSESRSVEIRDEGGAAVWAGKPLGCDVMKVLPVPGSEDAIVLLHPDAMRGQQFRNMLRLTTDGNERWIAELPDYDNADRYLDTCMDADGLNAVTWSGYSVQIDLDSGRIIKATFTK